MLEKFLIGHAEDEEKGTGVSVILAPDGAVGGVSVRGNAPGTRETDLLRSDSLVEKINAVVLSGGSAFGLEASCGVMKYLRENNIGYDTGSQIVPIVCGAVLYDLDYKEFAYPDINMGYEAALSATAKNNNMGCIGAGCGATVGKIFGINCASKSGTGIAYSKLEDIEIGALVAVNAFGDIYNKDNMIIAGAQGPNGFINTCNMITSGMKIDTTLKNTTIGCIFTNAELTKPQANKLADQVHNAYAKIIRPVHTMVDGDTIFSMASGEVKGEFIQIAEMAVQTMERAILNAIEKI